MFCRVNKMFFYLFLRFFLNLSLLLLFLLCSCVLCGYVCAESPEQQTDAVLFFFSGTQEVRTTFVNDSKRQVFLESLWSPSLVSADGVVVAFSAAFFTLNKFDSGVVAKYIWTEESSWVRDITMTRGNNLITQMVVPREEKLDNTYYSRTPIAVTKGNKIYLLVLNHKTMTCHACIENNYDFELELMVGEIQLTGDTEAAKNTIEWEKNENMSILMTQELKNKSLNVPLFDVTRSSFLTDDGTIGFYLRVKRGNKWGSAIMYAKETLNGMTWDWSYVDVPDNCLYNYFYFWKGQLNLLPILCSGDRRDVRASADMGKTWTNSDGVFLRLFNNSDDAGDFTTVTIGNKTILLFTQEINDGFDIRGNKLNMWFFDGARIYNVGPIIKNYAEIAHGGSLLYINDVLLSLYYVEDNFQRGVFFADHKDKVQLIKSVLNAWSRTDAYLLQLCNVSTTQAISFSQSTCVTPIPIDGLIGFLSNATNEDNTRWRDEYLYVDASVKEGTKVEGGFTFDTPGSGAKWSVGSHWREKKYNFGKHGLTIVATVTLHDVVHNDCVPLLTVGRVNYGANERQGLFFCRDKKWKVVLSRNYNASVVNEGETNKSYSVALVLLSNCSSLLVYVDGALLLRVPSGSSLVKGISCDVENIFIGGYDNNNNGGVGNLTAADRLTVTNVFLYNRQLGDAEINALRV